MYTSAVAVAAVYLASIFIVSAVLGCVNCASCGCIHPWNPMYYVGDALVSIAVIWGSAVYARDSIGVEDADGLLTAYLLLLAVLSTLLVATNGALVAAGFYKTRWILNACRVASSGFVVYTLYPGATTELSIESAPAGIVILLSIGILLILITPAVK